MSVSPDLLWPIVRDTSCFLQKRKQSGRSQMGKAGARMTTEPNNLTGINSFKYSGLANAKTVDLIPAEGGVTLVTKSRKSDRVSKPKKMMNKVTLSKDFRRVAKIIVKETTENFYRADLNKAALAKWSLIYKSQKRAKKDE
eukprot:CAMPEP_0183338938 /NCGR_PEP_ID=MMETSP0164_2-20130417/6051_1 /TAXON_ID=221442 /ORGANISM="Coccolithus pelagicus ssp braarudi, Strain PLY182g" /LENGTH=140 /DNA_ID=CAMNT_0025508865 /DNA_START=123 /DNA_END=545 /DNA_ORIENTATION=-